MWAFFFIFLSNFHFLKEKLKEEEANMRQKRRNESRKNERRNRRDREDIKEEKGNQTI